MAMRHPPGSRSNPPHLRPVRDYRNAKEIERKMINASAKFSNAETSQATLL